MTLHEAIALPTFVSLIAWKAAYTWVKHKCRSFLCSVNGGHHYLKHSESERMVLKCYYCGDETKGWDV